MSDEIRQGRGQAAPSMACSALPVALVRMAVELKAKGLYESSLPGGIDCAYRKYPRWDELPEQERRNWRVMVNPGTAVCEAGIHIDSRNDPGMARRPNNGGQPATPTDPES